MAYFREISPLEFDPLAGVDLPDENMLMTHAESYLDLREEIYDILDHLVLTRAHSYERGDFLRDLVVALVMVLFAASQRNVCPDSRFDSIYGKLIELPPEFCQQIHFSLVLASD